MRRLKVERSRGVPSLWALIVLALCIGASMFVTFRASAQSTRPPASTQEESATIKDDETLIPDDNESADNNVTFPIDI